jgi:WD40 repeat protein
MDEAETPPAGAYRYDAFISYSHAHDRQIAAVVQRQLQRFGRSWYRPRALAVFRDVTDLGASSGLTGDIERALAGSRWLIIMASPAAAASRWVQEEAAWWMRHRSADRVLIALTDGRIAWDDIAGTFDWAVTDALPREAFTGLHQQPRWVDVCWLRSSAEVDDADPRLQEATADLAAPLHGLQSKAEMIGEHLRQRRRTGRTVTGVIAALLMLLLVAVAGGVFAWNEGNDALRESFAASSRQLVAQAVTIQDSRPGLARQLLAQAWRLDPAGPAAGAVLGASVIPRVIPVDGSSRGVAFSPQGDAMAVASDAGVTIRHPRTTAELATIGGHLGYAGAVAFSADGRLLATGDARGNVRVYDVVNRRSPLLLSTALVWRDSIIFSVRFGGQGPLLAVTGGGAAVKLLDLADPSRPRLAASIAGFATAPLNKSAAFSPDGTLLAATGESGTARLWDVRNPVNPIALPSIGGQASTITFSPSSQFVVIGGEDDTTRVWDLADPAKAVLRATLHGQSSGISSVAFSHNGTTLAAGAGDGTVQLWSMRDPLRPVLTTTLTGHTSWINELAFSPDDTLLATASADGPDKLTADGRSSNGSVRLWRIVDGARSSAFVRLPSTGGASPVFTTTGRRLAAGFPTEIWELANPAAPRRLNVLGSHHQGAEAVAIGPDGSTLISGLPVSVLKIAVDGTAQHQDSWAPITDAAEVIQVQPHGTLVAAAARYGTVQLWDIANPDAPVQLLTLQDSVGGYQGLSFRPDGKMLATLGADGIAQFWDVTTPASPRLRGSIRQDADITSLAYGPDGRHLLVGDQRGGVSLWDAGDPGGAVRLSSVVRHVDSVDGLAFSPDGTFAVSGAQDGTARLWQISRLGRLSEAAVIDTAGRGATRFAFSADGALLAGSGAGGVQLWDMDVRTMTRRLCAESTRITEAEWNQYLPDRPYDPPCG